MGPADGSQDPYLYVPSEDSGHYTPKACQRYIALSYCWGSHLWAERSTPILTASSLETMKTAIRMTDLPQTIHDAVVITRRLGIRYLWVDALCILQGSDAKAKADWERESSRMATTYGNAFLTVAAASARSVHEGIFSDRKCLKKQIALKVSSANYESVDNHVYVQHSTTLRDCLDEPLYHRGWTLQERMLSPRVLIFTCDQLVWNCQTENTIETGVTLHALGQQRLRTEDILRNGGALKSFWHAVVREYSRRILTDPTDKLPALSGMAAALHQRTGDKYLAGLWERSILHDLLWMNRASSRGTGDQVEPSRPPHYRAPSWSWASVDGDIRLPRSLNPSASWFARCLSYHVTTSGIDNFGAVSDGWIRLRGPLVQVLKVGLDCGSKLMVLAGRDRNLSVGLGHATLDAGEVAIAKCKPESSEGFADVWVLRITERAGLVLEAVHDSSSLSAWTATVFASKVFTKGLASITVQRLQDGVKHLPWITPPTFTYVPPIRSPVPRRFRRLGLVEFDMVGMGRSVDWERQTVTIL